jgi:hypothetical protein
VKQTSRAGAVASAQTYIESKKDIELSDMYFLWLLEREYIKHHLARQIDPAAIPVTERKASLLIDVAQAFFQWGKYGQPYTALRAAEPSAPQEVAARAPVRTLARNLAALAPPGTHRDAAHLADRTGAHA